MQNQRNMYIDVIKAISILLVVVGHCIQYGAGIEYLQSGVFLYHRAFIFIYSFHMPLFMLISGYLFALSCKNKSSKQLLINKVKQLLVPLFCWSFVSLFVQMIKIAVGASAQEITFLWMCQTVNASFWGGPWFLWALWWSSVVLILGRTLCKDNALFYLAICLACFVVPDLNNTAMYKYMFPFFYLAYAFNKYDYKSKFKKIYSHKLFALGSVIVFAVFLPFYNFDTYIYTTGYCVLGKNVAYQLHNDCFRFFIGITGSVAIMCVLGVFMESMPQNVWKPFAYIGANTLGIYIISNYLFDEVLKRLPIAGLHFGWVVLESVCVLSVALGITYLLKKYKYTNRLFLGGR